MTPTVDHTTSQLTQLATAYRRLLTRHAGLREHPTHGLTEGTMGRHPGSRPPGDLTPLAVVQGIRAFAYRISTALGKTHDTTTPAALTWITNQLDQCDPDDLAVVSQETGRWLSAARDLLEDTDPALRRRLREPCPYCTGMTLRYSFRAGTVRCTNPDCRMQPDDPGPPVWTLLEFVPHLIAREHRLAEQPPTKGTAA